MIHLICDICGKAIGEDDPYWVAQWHHDDKKPRSLKGLGYEGEDQYCRPCGDTLRETIGKMKESRETSDHLRYAQDTPHR